MRSPWATSAPARAISTYQRNMNLINPISYLADGRPVYSSAVNAATRLYPQYNGITFQDTGASLNYNAMIVNYPHRCCGGVPDQRILHLVAFHQRRARDLWL